MERTCMNFSDFFINFISSYARYVHDEPIYTGYVSVEDCIRSSRLPFYLTNSLGSVAGSGWM
jgi:hypothetical protein